MYIDQYATPMHRQRAGRGFVCPAAPLMGIEGRIASGDPAPRRRAP